jgi:large subunit ribosomal protein L29
MLVKMKLNHHISPLDNPLKIRRVRRLVATMVTELHSRELKEKNK